MARIAAPFGIKGWLKVQTFTEYADSLDQFDSWFVSSANGWQEIEVEDFAVNVKSVVAKLKGIDDRTAAEKLGKRDIAVPRSWLDQPDGDEYYWIDLIGTSVVNEAGEVLGTVETLMETGANDVLVVRSGKSAGSTEILIPFVSEYLANVDRQNKVVTVRWERHWQENDSKDRK
ncbi:MAG: ribosome maturation factor RimM [Rhodocyclaceae bacterium]|nr:ribosome maturation factor RimM [Rhodocyclaceae bacterium]MCA3025642.1 ribosome maturation factor RimM [Rhodocyclaceae bacterium]MCA3030789.1 ribosome maturation factor RimM [Rhodocyclaceae bacterium]MCA3036007.1 ribosome maturation factor RimM [Rhodocyclaceae bacterium]MCA3047598.1 ribosome maturation factor RimM [Rhodocyclaceae bacterium]